MISFEKKNFENKFQESSSPAGLLFTATPPSRRFSPSVCKPRVQARGGRSVLLPSLRGGVGVGGGASFASAYSGSGVFIPVGAVHQPVVAAGENTGHCQEMFPNPPGLFLLISIIVLFLLIFWLLFFQSHLCICLSDLLNKALAHFSIQDIFS